MYQSKKPAPKIPMVSITDALLFTAAVKNKNPKEQTRLIDKAIKDTKLPLGKAGKKYKKLFDKIDTDKSGKISLKEFTKYCKKKGMSITKSKKLFKKYDKNNDKTLSRKEFSKIKFPTSNKTKKMRGGVGTLRGFWNQVSAARRK